MKIAALVLTTGKVRPNSNRKSYDSFGFMGLEIVLDIVRNNGNAVDYCTVGNIKDYDYVLWSITAPEDISTFLGLVGSGCFKKGNAKIIVGGAGCINICSIYDYIDIAVFGRGETLIIKALSSVVDNHIWYKSADIKMENEYSIMQALTLDDREGSCGCNNKCFFCQYTWVRKLTGETYQGPKQGYVGKEDDFKNLELNGSGRYITAWDGLSEATRKRVNKGFVTDALIVEKFSLAISHNHEKAIMLKIFGIVGYPWETKKQAINDADKIGSLLAPCNEAGNGRLMGAIHLTPFSPEPLTPMEHCPANITINWRAFFGGRSYALINEKNINVFIGPYITTPPTLARRVLINRCKLQERAKIQKIIMSGLDGVKGFEIKKKVDDFLGRDVFGWQDDERIVPYLNSYSDASKIGKKFFNKGE